MAKKRTNRSSKRISRPNKDSISGDRITIHHVGHGTAVAGGRGASATIEHISGSPTSLKSWRHAMELVIDGDSHLSDSEKKDLKDQVAKIEAEANKGKKAERGRIEKLINTLGVLAPDIFDVAITTLVNPLLGIGLVLKKIGDKAKLEVEDKSSS